MPFEEFEESLFYFLQGSSSVKRGWEKKPELVFYCS